jgi:DNA-binding response OmpR family regulator/anti-sigma regulatory factor (Ser/Thr protein kinase)
MIKLKVIFIDDDVSIADTVKDLLELDNFLVKTCSKPKDAIDLIKRWRPEIILCDIMMPEIDGFELVKKIKIEKEIAHIPIIFITAKNLEDTFRRSMSVGIDDFINKPFVIAEVKEAILSRLNRYKEIKNNPYFDIIQENKKYKENNITSPLYGLLGSIQLFTNRNSDPNKKNENIFFPDIKKTEYRLSRTFQNIILLKQRVKDKPKEIRYYNTEVKKTIDDTIFELCNLHVLSKERFKIDIQKKHININPIDLSYLLFEILSNAIKFSQFDTIIEIKSEELKNTTQLIIKDHGRGFAINEIRSISPLNQFERETKDYSGLGIGIPLCKKLVEKMNGEFKIDSKKNRYTKVYIKMPKH